MTRTSAPTAGASARAGSSRLRALAAVPSADAASVRPGELTAERREPLQDDMSLVAVVGEVDMHTAPVLAATLEQAAADQVVALIVDLTECSFIDSTGVGVLVAANTRLRNSGRRLALVVPDQRLLTVFELTGAAAVLTIGRSRETTIAAVSESWNDEARRRISIRDTNEQLEKSCLALAPSVDDRFVFVCECGDRACRSLLRISLAEYESVRAHPARFVIARNHENPEAERVVDENGWFAVVETVTGHLSRPARASNPRWQRGGPW